MKNLIFALVMIPSLAIAGGRPNNDNQIQGQAQKQAQHQTQHQKAEGGNAHSRANSKSGAAAKSISGAAAISGGGHADSNAQGGNAVVGEGVGQSNVDVQGDTTITETSIDYERNVAAAAVVFAGQCQRGLSGSLEEGGFSIVDTRQFCDLIEMANINWQAHIRAMDCNKKPGIPVCRSGCKPGDARYTKDGMPRPACSADCKTPTTESCRMTPEAQHYLELYHKNLASAQALIDRTEVTGTVDRVGSQLFKPLAILLALIWII